jgi:hypothetical protein
MLDERVKLVAITHVPTNGGLVNHYFNTEHEIAQLADAVQHMAERRGTTDGREGT